MKVPILVSWVKGHAKHIDVVRGRTTREDMNGNNGADELAVAGASMHQFSSEVVDAAKERKEMAVHVQQMMVSILKARFLAEGCSSNDAGDDRGSDMSDCMEDEVLDDENDSAGAILCDDADSFVPGSLRSGAPSAENAGRGPDMDECMEFELLDLHDTEVRFDDVVAQVDVPEDTLGVEGLSDNMHEHVVQMNSLDDKFGVGLD